MNEVGVYPQLRDLSDRDCVNNVSSPCNIIHANPPPIVGLVEFLSRQTRKKIVESICEALLKEMREIGNTGMKHKKRGPPFSSGATLLASRLGLSRQSVNRWLNNEMQSSNSNAIKILDVAMEYIPDTLKEVLHQDVERHRIEVERYLMSHGDAP